MRLKRKKMDGVMNLRMII